MKPVPPEPRDRERFLAAVAEHVPLDRVAELYLFQPIRQGGVESGVAVIAAATDAPAAPAGSAEPADTSADRAVAAAGAREPAVADPGSRGAASDSVAPAQRAADAPAPADQDRAEPRYTVFTARYRHVLKGPERGRWEVSVVAEADAPLAAIGAVVRGVQRRAGDMEPPEHLTGDELRGALGHRPAGAP